MCLCLGHILAHFLCLLLPTFRRAYHRSAMNRLWTKLCSQASIIKQYAAFSEHHLSYTSKRMLAKYDNNNNGDDNSDNGQFPPLSWDLSKLEEARKLIPQRYKEFNDEHADVIYDGDVIDLETVLNQKQKHLKVPSVVVPKNVSFRGESGVFDIHEVVAFAHQERLQDIVTILVPSELKYCDYMVICTVTSFRQLKRFLETLQKLYKIKKDVNDPFLNLNDDSKDWRLVDMGNVILHLFTAKTREQYDLETLWTVGEKFDDKTQRPEFSVVEDILEKHITFIQQQSQPISSTK